MINHGLQPGWGGNGYTNNNGLYRGGTGSYRNNERVQGRPLGLYISNNGGERKARRLFNLKTARREVSCGDTSQQEVTVESGGGGRSDI